MGKIMQINEQLFFRKTQSNTFKLREKIILESYSLKQTFLQSVYSLQYLTIVTKLDVA